MDNKKNTLEENFKGVMQLAGEIVKQVKTGEGLGLNPEEKKKFKAEVKNHGTDKLVAELQSKMNEFKESIQKMNRNGATN